MINGSTFLKAANLLGMYIKSGTTGDELSPYTMNPAAFSLREE